MSIRYQQNLDGITPAQLTVAAIVSGPTPQARTDRVHRYLDEV